MYVHYLRKRQACRMSPPPPLPELHKRSVVASQALLQLHLPCLRRCCVGKQASSISSIPPAAAAHGRCKCRSAVAASSIGIRTRIHGDGAGAHADVSTAPGRPPSTRLASLSLPFPTPSHHLHVSHPPGIGRREIPRKRYRVLGHFIITLAARIQPHRCRRSAPLPGHSPCLPNAPLLKPSGTSLPKQPRSKTPEIEP